MPKTGQRRLQRTTWAAIALACLIAAVAGGWALWDRSHTYDASVPGDVLISGDGRTLTTPVIWTGCEDEPRLVAHESARTVSLELERKQHASVPKNAACIGDGGDNQRALTTTLGRPLGGRTLSDAVSHDIIRPFEAPHIDHPRYLPKGYAPSDKPIGPGDVTQPPYRRTRTPSWTVTYLRNPGQGGDTGSLSISQTTGRITEGPGTSVSVHGHPGHMERGPLGEQHLTWYAAGYTFDVHAADRLLTEGEFLKVADQLGP
ncbi:hypothetical protein [Streptomyces tropicalis]|uniref:Secreted protein n=1 Tax=Streptomyces tropicalis TaxID=3034234 RepID=A0ABT6ADH0_9ACTN|nr:hypothetical protein [Streptomyces tropicalis]MDF3302508.1 hypothetical protein [Streptomyces tropicalis]